METDFLTSRQWISRRRHSCNDTGIHQEARFNMRAKYLYAFIGLSCVLVARITPAHAGPVTFDDVVSAPICNSAIPNGYAGLVWPDFQLECDADYMGTFGNPYGSPSGEYAAFNAFGLAAVELTATAGTFDFGGASFTSWAQLGAFSDPSAPFSAQSLALVGYRPGDLPDFPTYHLELELDPTMYVAHSLGWTGLERVLFVNGDGVNFNINGLSWLMDDVDVTVSIVPEPAALAVFSLGLTLAISRRRRPRGSCR